MNISINNFKPYTPKISAAVNYRPKALGFDTVSFSGNGKTLTKSGLSGFDFLCNELFKFPLEKMTSQEDFNDAAKKETAKIFGADYPCKRKGAGKIAEARKEELKKWEEYLTQKSPSCKEKPSIALIIAKGLVKNLKTSNEALPAVLNEKVLEATIDQLSGKLADDKRYNFNFMEQYGANLRTYYLEKVEKENFSGEDENGFWIKTEYEPQISLGGPKKGESEDDYDKRVDEAYEKYFEESVKKLRVLSHPNWCTSSYMAAKYVREGDFHIYIENGETKFAIRFEGDKIAEIEEPENNRTIQASSAGVLDRYIAKNGYKYQSSSNVDNDFIRLNAALAEPVKNKDYFKILDCLGFEPEKLESGKFSINGYNKVSYDQKLSNFGIDENELFKNIEIINGDVDLSDMELTDFGALRAIEGDLKIGNCPITSLGEIQKVGGDLTLRGANVEDMGKLQEVGGNADLSETKIERLKYLKKVGKDLDLRDSSVRRLDHLEEVGGNLFLKNSRFEQTAKPKVKKPDGTVKTLPKFEKLQKVGGNIFISEYAYTDEMDADIWKRSGLGMAKFV